MENFWFYLKMGLEHVLDLAAYDHILFLTILTVPFTFKSWKKVVFLATVFTVAHCISLALSAYKVIEVNVSIIEFLIPVTILLTAIFNLRYFKAKEAHKNLVWHGIATAFFGLIHGFGFSNYFKMLMAEEEDIITPLLGFATGIELSQLVIVLSILVFAFIVQSIFKLKQALFVLGMSILVILITLPMLRETYPF
ncbi:HupE/UreJ family protein [Cellulophaga sp. Hel_I_12]|uniref:HupE/UreJ family protein n=1 Tax=Cellulophaga sp. Hel_I_12 TaxID=1249972 RepID=UPI0006456BC8|nr:HupE/UreJ family protein [Cellulophaga sp. Hel_I_12]